jgi:preprotein translocase subunit YajC
MNSLIPDAMAQTAGGAPARAGTTSLIMMAVFVVIFYFLLIRPSEEAERAPGDV